MSGFGSSEKFCFCRYLQNKWGPWIRCDFYGNAVTVSFMLQIVFFSCLALNGLWVSRAIRDVVGYKIINVFKPPHSRLAPKTMCHVGTKRAKLSFLPPRPSGEWGLTLIEPLRPYFCGSTRRGKSDGKKLSILLTLAPQPQSMEHHQQSYWQVQTLLPPMPQLSKLHRLTTRENKTKPRVHKARVQGGVWPVEGPNIWGR